MRQDAQRAAAVVTGTARDEAAAWATALVLLLDEALIREQRGIRREVQVGSKSPVLVAPDRDKPWEYGADLAAVNGAVQIRFLLTRSRLYGYRWS